MPPGHVIALDVGGTAVKGAAVDRQGRPLHIQRLPSLAALGPVKVAEQIDAVVLALLEAAGTPVAAGIGVPGVVDEESGIAVRSGNLGWTNLALRDRVSSLAGAPAALGHDVRLAGRAEGFAGAASGARNWLFVIAGTGIGGAIYIDARPYAGREWSAGEIGHIPVVPGGVPCVCGARGCVEMYSSGKGMAARHRERTGEAIDGVEICRRAAAGDRECEKTWRQAIEVLADGIAAANVLFTPEVVVIGGGVSNAGEALFGPLNDAVAERCHLSSPPPVRRAALGTSAGARGSALLAWELGGQPCDPKGYDLSGWDWD